VESDRLGDPQGVGESQHPKVSRDVLETIRRRTMKRYRGVLVFRYYQQVEVEAESQEEAESAMFAELNLSKAEGESEVLDIEEIKE
jgi:hypothetical protein